MQLTVDSGQLPEGWEIKKLGEVYDVRDGTHDSPKYLPECYALITSKNLKNNGLSFKNVNYISEVDYKKINERSAVHKGDILLAMIGTIGNPIVVEVEPEFAIKNVALIKVPRNQSSYFLRYYLETEYVQSKMQREAKGTTQKFVGLGYLRDFPIILPPPSEQKRIVAILDEAFEGIDRAIANTEKNLANSRELFESYLKAIFTQKGDEWEKKTLQEISIKFTRGKSKHRPRGDKKLYGGKYPLIQTGDISNAKHRITSYSQTYNELGLAQSAIWPQGTVCIAIVGANVAETAILDFDACFPDSVIGIIVNNKVADSDYLEYLLQFFKAELKEKGKGTARDNINIGTFANQRFPFPDVKTQKIIASQLDELSFETQRLETIYQQKITALNELKQSILQKAFTGELTADTPKTAKEGIAA